MTIFEKQETKKVEMEDDDIVHAGREEDEDQVAGDFLWSNQTTDSESSEDQDPEVTTYVIIDMDKGVVFTVESTETKEVVFELVTNPAFEANTQKWLTDHGFLLKRGKFAVSSNENTVILNI